MRSNPFELLNKLTEERDALRSGLEQAANQLKRAHEIQKQAEARIGTLRANVNAKQEEIEALRQELLTMEAENRRLRRLVAEAAAGAVKAAAVAAEVAANSIDPFSATDPEPEYFS